MIPMNPLVRKYLIETARLDNKMVYYSDLVKACLPKIDLNTPEGREALKQNLIAVSRYEHAHDRPLLSSMAINKEQNDHGNAFYDLAEELGFGKNKKNA
jgi:hypothetical protein